MYLLPYLVVKAQQHFVNTGRMFLDKKTLLKIFAKSGVKLYLLIFEEPGSGVKIFCVLYLPGVFALYCGIHI